MILSFHSIAVACLGWSAAVPPAQLDVRSMHPSAVVVSALTGTPLANVVVEMTTTSGAASASTDQDGYAVFTTLTVTNTLNTLDPLEFEPTLEVAELPAQEKVTIRISDPEFVPVSVTRPLSSDTKMTLVSLMPTTRTVSTELIDAVRGGVYFVPGAGRLTVPPNCLGADASIHVIPLQPVHYSDSPTGYELIDQFWVGTKNAAGQWFDAMPAGHCGLTLLRTLPRYQEIHEEHYSVTLEASVPLDAGTVASQVIGSRRRGRVQAPIGLGVNSISRYWDPGTLPDGFYRRDDGVICYTGGEVCESPPDLIATGKRKSKILNVILKSSRITQISTTPMRCGEYDNTASAEVEAGETVTTTHELETSVLSEFSEEVDATIVKASAKVGVNTKVGTTEGTTVSTVRKGKVEVVQGTMLSDGECFNADVVLGMVINTYTVWVGTQEVCLDSAGNTTQIERHQKRAGDIDIAMGVAVWWNNMKFDESCPDCAGTNPEAPNVPGVHTD